jgi:hypothetical protein
MFQSPLTESCVKLSEPENLLKIVDKMTSNHSSKIDNRAVVLCFVVMAAGGLPASVSPASLRQVTIAPPRWGPLTAGARLRTIRAASLHRSRRTPRIARSTARTSAIAWWTASRARCRAGGQSRK